MIWRGADWDFTRTGDNLGVKGCIGLSGDDVDLYRLVVTVRKVTDIDEGG